MGRRESGERFPGIHFPEIYSIEGAPAKSQILWGLRSRREAPAGRFCQPGRLALFHLSGSPKLHSIFGVNLAESKRTSSLLCKEDPPPLGGQIRPFAKSREAPAGRFCQPGRLALSHFSGPLKMHSIFEVNLAESKRTSPAGEASRGSPAVQAGKSPPGGHSPPFFHKSSVFTNRPLKALFSFFAGLSGQKGV